MLSNELLKLGLVPSEWKKLGNREGNSVLNRDLYAIAARQEHIERAFALPLSIRNILYVAPAAFVHLPDFEIFQDELLRKIDKDNTYLATVVKNYSDAVSKCKEWCESGEIVGDTLLDQFRYATGIYLQLLPYTYLNFNEEAIPLTIFEKYVTTDELERTKLLTLPRKTLFMLEQDALCETEDVGKHVEQFPWIKSKYFHREEVTVEETAKRKKTVTRTTIPDVTLPRDPHAREIVLLLRELLFLKTVRKELLSWIGYKTAPVLKKIARVLKIPYDSVISMTVQEIEDGLAGTDINKVEIQERHEIFAHTVIRGTTHVLGGAQYTELTHSAAHVTGTCGNPGNVTGQVGKDLLVIDSVRPHHVAEFHGIKGVITNHGGILSHAVVLAQERGIPCLVGTQHATSVFEEGDTVELNATEGSARRLLKFRKMFGITMGLNRADLYMPTHVFNTADVLGEGHDDIMFKIRDGKITGYFEERAIRRMGEIGLEKLTSKVFVKQNLKEVEEVCMRLWSYAEYVNSLPLKTLPTDELKRRYNDLFDMMQQCFGYFNVSQPCISFALEDEIHNQLSHFDADTQYEITEVMLKQEETTLIEDEERELLELVSTVDPELLSLSNEEIIERIHHLNDHLFFDRLLAHEAKYGFLAQSEDFDLFHRGYFLDRLREFSTLDQRELQERIDRNSAKNFQAERAAVTDKHDLAEETAWLLDVARIYSHQRMHIRITWTKGVHAWGNILREVARRSDMSERDMQYIVRSEVNDLLEGKKPDPRSIEERKEFCVYTIFDRGEPQIHVGAAAKKLEQEYLKEELPQDSVVKGMPASKGKYTGKVKLLDYGKNMLQQMADMEQGDVLVTGNTRPDMMLALQKAGAVVTDEGGIMSHAALVSRELGIPCIVGTKDGTGVFKDGQKVKVDANAGTAQRIVDEQR